MVELISDKASEMKIVTLACKVLLMLGLARSNVEDFLVLSGLISKPRTYTIDLRDELKILQDQAGQQSAFIVSGTKFEPGSFTS